MSPPSLLRRLPRLPHHPRVRLACGLLALAAAAALVWWGGPRIVVGGHRPFDGPWPRALVIALLAALGLAALWAGWRRGRDAAAGAGADPGARGADRIERERAQVDQRFAEALQLLDDGARAAGRRAGSGRDAHRYDLPWYLVIGAPDAGKTTALLDAGLTFPLAARMGQAPVRAAGGTRHCDWWLTDEAVLIDTAGRYALQRPDEPADAAGWTRVLELLRKSRPRRPLNGVLLAISIQDLLQRPPAERKDHAARLRAGLQELHRHLGVRPPVYVLITKTDRVAGFHETFGGLDAEDRAQVWGFTFPHDASGQDTPVQAFGNEFAALEKRLRERLLDRLEAESDPLRRAAVFAFPQQFAGLKGLLGGFLEGLFGGGGELEERALLRGVYFTSATQEGAPIDRVLATLARTFGIDAGPASIAASRGRSFFLARLLREVVFAEQGLVGENRRAETGRRRRRRLARGAIVLTSLALIAGWSVSHLRNQAYVARVADRLPALRQAVDALTSPSDADLGALPAVLDRVVAAPLPPDHDIDRPPLLDTLGLHQGDHLRAGADIGYRRLLQRALLPHVERRLEERLRSADRSNLELAYEALKGYLMLHVPEHFDATALAAWITLDWDTHLAGTLTSEQRAALAVHLDAALAMGAPRAVAPLDADLVARVRDLLNAHPLEYRVFSRLQRARVGADLPEFSVATAGGPNAAQVFERASGQPITRGIPGLFTRQGYFTAFQGAVAGAARQLEAEQGWVLGLPTPPTQPSTPMPVRSASPTDATTGAPVRTPGGTLDERVRRLYLQEYVRVWDAYLADVRLVRLAGLEDSLTVARVLAAPDSPLPAYLRAAARETQLLDQAASRATAASPGPGSGPDAARLDEKAAKARQDLAVLSGAPPELGAHAAGAPLEAMVDDHFLALHRLVAGTPAPIDEVGRQFNDVFGLLGALDAARRSHSAPPPAAAGIGAAARAAAALQPEPVRSMLESLADVGVHQGRHAERRGLAVELRPLAEFCARAIAGRYPFAPGATADVLPDDFGQLFGMGGLFDDFTQRHLAPLIDTSHTPWTYKPLPDGSPSPGGAALADFQRAARIREAFFRQGGKAPGFRVDLRLTELAPGLREITLDIDGQVLRFAAGDTSAQTIAWPGGRVASRIRLAAGDGAPRTFEGPWALFRLLGAFEAQPSPQPERFTVLLDLDGRSSRLEVTTSSAINPLRMRELTGFRCPNRL